MQPCPTDLYTYPDTFEDSEKVREEHWWKCRQERFLFLHTLANETVPFLKKYIRTKPLLPQQSFRYENNHRQNMHYPRHRASVRLLRHHGGTLR